MQDSLSSKAIAKTLSGRSISPQLANNMSLVLEAYAETLSWKHVLEIACICSRKTLVNYNKNALFKQKVAEIQSLILAESQDKLINLMRHAESEDVQFKSSVKILESYNPEQFDAGVRREKARASVDVLKQMFSQQNGATVVLDAVDKLKASNIIESNNMTNNISYQSLEVQQDNNSELVDNAELSDTKDVEGEGV